MRRFVPALLGALALGPFACSDDSGGDTGGTTGSTATGTTTTSTTQPPSSSTTDADTTTAAGSTSTTGDGTTGTSDGADESTGTTDGDGGEVTLLAYNVYLPAGLALTSTDVYWVGGGLEDPGYMSMCEKQDCDGQPTTVLMDQAGPMHIVVDGGMVYWSLLALTGLCSRDGLVMQCDAADCAGTAAPLVNALCTSGLAVDEQNVYYGNWGGGTGTLERCSRAGCGGTGEVLADVPGGPRSLALSGSTLVWAADDSVMACDTLGCVPQVLASGLGVHPVQVAADAQHAYWTNGDGSIMKCALTGCGNAPLELARGQDLPYAIATDGVDVVWSTSPMGPGGIYVIAADGSEMQPTTLVFGEFVFTPASLALDEQSVYWTDINTDLVAKIARSP